MRKYFLLLGISAFVAFSCSDNQQNVLTSPDSVNTNKKEIAVEEKSSSSESVIKEDSELYKKIKSFLPELENKYPCLPLAYVGETQVFYWVSTQTKKSFNINTKEKNHHWGLIDQSGKELLETKYDKIYNPNLLLAQCVEIELAGKLGVYNYISNKIVAPQFEYIIPSRSTNANEAYGLKDGQWFKINAEDLTITETTVDVAALLKAVQLDLKNMSAFLLKDVYYEQYENDPTEGNLTLITPSYLYKTKLVSEEFINDLVNPNEQVDFGRIAYSVENDQSENLTDKVQAFFVKIYDEGIDGRGYNMETTQLLVYQKESKRFDQFSLYTLYSDEGYCTSYGYKIKNDSIIEVKTADYAQNKMKGKYDFQTAYKYFQISKDGKILELKSNRIFHFTKFVKIDESYFEGCYYNYVERQSEDYTNNIKVYDRLSIEDLDVMRNEIFADYGYKFQDPNWQNYFGKLKWYKPLYADIDSYLTAIDRHNIEVILKMQSKMKANEVIVNEKLDTYYPAG